MEPNACQVKVIRTSKPPRSFLYFIIQLYKNIIEEEEESMYEICGSNVGQVRIYT